MHSVLIAASEKMLQFKLLYMWYATLVQKCLCNRYKKFNTKNQAAQLNIWQHNAVRTCFTPAAHKQHCLISSSKTNGVMLVVLVIKTHNPQIQS